MRSQIVALAVILVALISATPLAYASTVHYTLNPKSKSTVIDAVTEVVAVLKYPSNSVLEQALNGSEYSLSATGTASSSSPNVQVMEQALSNRGLNLSVRQMNITFALTAHGNTTTFVIKKDVSVSALVYGTFNVSKGKLEANLAWKAFDVRSKLYVPLEDGENVDVNYVGSSVGALFAGKSFLLGALVLMFQHTRAWDASTLNFSVLNSPLSTWTRNYDSSTNTTTFSKSVSRNVEFSASYSSPEGNYSLTISYDPSSTVTVPGYATASGNTLVISASPAPQLGLEFGAVAVVVILVVVGAAFYFSRRR
ncbi:MAG: hypothetical protein QW767_05710 [Thermoprotei archaeon]